MCFWDISDMFIFSSFIFWRIYWWVFLTSQVGSSKPKWGLLQRLLLLLPFISSLSFRSVNFGHWFNLVCSIRCRFGLSVSNILLLSFVVSHVSLIWDCSLVSFQFMVSAWTFMDLRLSFLFLIHFFCNIFGFIWSVFKNYL